jgi:SAM-dependent methyltransferase
MPEINEILEAWDWSADGDEWSRGWGGTESMWWGSLLPRIHSFVPAARGLELAPGRGRWTQFLKDLCQELVIVDISPACIEACRERFAGSDNLDCHVGDGKTLPMVADGSIDFAFSFDSLVHAEADVMESYARELGRILTADGIAFLHHSNQGEYAAAASRARRIPNVLRERLIERGLLVNTRAWRADSTTAKQFRGFCDAAGLAVVSQELITWAHGRHLIDVISVVTPRGSRWERPTVVVENRKFMDEAHDRARIAPLYGASTWGVSE